MERLFAILGLLVFAGFLGFLIFRLQAIDLTIVLIGAILMAAWDFWLTFKPKRGSRAP